MSTTPTMLLDASWGDMANIQAVYDGTSVHGTIYLKDGAKWNPYFNVVSDLKKTVRWIAQGSADYGEGTLPGGYPMGAAQTWDNPITGPGDCDTFEAYTGGSHVITKTAEKNPLNAPMMVVHYMNKRSVPVPGNQQMLVLNGSVSPGAIGNVYPLSVNISSHGMGGFGCDDVPLTTSCVQYGTNSGWGAVLAMYDCSGLGTDRPTKKWGTETDMQGSGPEQNGYWYNPYTGGRNGALLALAHWSGGNSWQAGHTYAVGAIIQNVAVVDAAGKPVMRAVPVVDASGNPTLQTTLVPQLFNAVCTTAGTSGATMPVFEMGAGAKPGLNADGSALIVDDGTAAWQITVTMFSQFAQGHLVTTDAMSSVARCYDAYATVDDAVFSAWAARMNHPEGKGAGLRLAPNQPIDLNAGMENWGPRQNTRTIMFNGTSSAFEYAVNGKVVFSVGDNGDVTITGKLIQPAA